MREIGAADAFLYLTNTGRGYSMEIQIDMVFSDPVDPAALARAADEALSLFPEFAVQLVVVKGRLMYRENKRPVRLILTEEPMNMTVNYGTEDTNGHAIYLCADRRDMRRVTFSYLHGLSDYAGGMRYLKTLLYRYQLIVCPEKKTSSDELSAAGIRTSVPENWQDPENLDPYSLCRPGKMVSAARPRELPFCPEGMKLFPIGSEVNHVRHVVTDSRAFHEKCREAGTSFAPLIIDTLIGSVAECFGAGEKTVAAALPINMRPVFGMDTVTNFSDGVLLTENAAQRRLSVGERCARIKKQLTEQRTVEYMASALCDKTAAARKMLDDPDGFAAFAARFMAPVLSGEPRRAPMSFVATYPGRMDLPACLNGLVTGLMPASVLGKTNFFFIISTCGSTMTFRIMQRFDDDCLARSLARKLEELGLEAQVIDKGLRRQGCLQPELLECAD